MPSYKEWNELLLESFFYHSQKDSVIRLDVSPAWFASLPPGYNRDDLVKEVCSRSEFQDMLRNALESRENPPDYLPLLAFFCIPWGEMDEDDDGSYYNYLEQNITEKTEYCMKIKNFTQVGGRFANYIPELFYKLKRWADNDINVKGTFCFARLHRNTDNRCTFFRSQILLRPRDERIYLRRVFKALPVRCYRGEDDLLSCLRNPINANRLPAGIINLWDIEDNEEKEAQSMREMLQKDAANVIYSVYEDWVNEGRPEPEDDRVVYTYTKKPLLLLGLMCRNGQWQKSLLTKDDCNDNGISIDGNNFTLQKGAYISNLDSNNMETVWNNLAKGRCDAGPSLQFNKSNCYVMAYEYPYIIQSNNIAPNEDFYLLYSSDDVQNRFSIYLARQTFGLGEGLSLAFFGHENRRIIENDVGHQQIRLVGGEKTQYRCGLKEYLEDFLPTIEAYLPDNNWNWEATKGILLEQIDENNNLHNTTIQGGYRWRRFAIIVNVDKAPDLCTIKFTIDNNSEIVAFYIRTEPTPIVRNSCRMDKYGELENNIQRNYWPDVPNDNEACNIGLETIQAMEDWDKSDANLDDFKWDFYRVLRDDNGNNGIRADKLYKKFIYYYTKDASPWKPPREYRNELLLLSYLSVLDIKTNDQGQWSRFFPLPPTIYPLPDGKNFILTGCYYKSDLEQLRDNIRQSENDCKIMIRHHNPGLNIKLKLLPPLVKLTGAKEKLMAMANQLNIEWVKTPPAIGFVQFATSVQEWFDMIKNGNQLFDRMPLDGIYWYSPLLFSVEKMNNPLDQQNPSIQLN